MIASGLKKYSKNLQSKCEPNHHLHKVRCCSSGESKPSTAGGWVKSKSKCGTMFSASQKMMDGDSHKDCRPMMNYNDANEYCSSVNARLCTIDEMENDCTSGCSLSKHYIWTDSVPTPDLPDVPAGPPPIHLEEKNGFAQCEIEEATNKMWARGKGNGASGFYYEWKGSNYYKEKQAGVGVLTYNVQITKPGRYQIEVRKFHDNPDNTESNDLWLQVDSYGWVKIYDGTVGKWEWDTYQSWENIPGKIWNEPQFNMGVGLHTIKISARSKGIRIDGLRIMFNDEAIPTTEPRTTRTPRATKSPKTMADMHMIEVDGYAMAEVEDIPTGKRGWSKQTSIAGFSGTGYYKWTQNNKYSLSQAGKNGVLTFEVFVTNPGDYTVQIRKYHDNVDNTVENDCWLEVDEHEIIKVFDGTVGEWDETTLESWEGRDLYLKKTNDPRYYLTAGFHTIRVSARSKGLAIDTVSITKINHSKLNPF